MEWLSGLTGQLGASEFLFALLSIIMIDIVLAGDNAIVIALAARNLPPVHQKRAIIWGTVGAIVVRTAMTLVVVWLLRIPGLRLVGGLALLWIAYRLVTDTGGDHHEGGGNATFWAAIKTIVIADAVMGVDNVLAVAGAAHGNFLLVVIGLLISVPIMVWGSRLILKLMERYSFILYIGAAILAVTSAKMVLGEALLKPTIEAIGILSWIVYPIALGIVLGAGYRVNKKRQLLASSAV